MAARPRSDSSAKSSRRGSAASGHSDAAARATAKASGKRGSVSKAKGGGVKLPQISTSSSSQLLEDSTISAPLSLSEPSATMQNEGGSPKSEQRPVSRGSDEGGSPKKGKRGKKKKKKEEVEERPETPPFRGPPPDEEFFDDVLVHVKTVEKWKPKDYIESLHKVLREGEEAIGQEVDTRNQYGFTPLAVAAAAGDAPLVALLLEHRADVSLGSTERSELPLHHAVNYKHRVVVQLLSEPCRKLGIIDARTSTGWTPLHTCAHSGDYSCFKILLKARADLETRNPITGNEHALHVAARASNMDIIEILLAADSDVNCKDSLNRTPLHLAAGMTHADCVGLLLRSKADPHIKGGPAQVTALESVPENNAPERDKVLRLLTSYGRQAPTPWRVDIRFDVSDSRDLI